MKRLLDLVLENEMILNIEKFVPTINPSDRTLKDYSEYFIADTYLEILDAALRSGMTVEEFIYDIDLFLRKKKNREKMLWHKIERSTINAY